MVREKKGNVWKVVWLAKQSTGVTVAVSVGLELTACPNNMQIDCIQRE